MKEFYNSHYKTLTTVVALIVLIIVSMIVWQKTDEKPVLVKPVSNTKSSFQTEIKQVKTYDDNSSVLQITHCDDCTPEAIQKINSDLMSLTAEDCTALSELSADYTEGMPVDMQHNLKVENKFIFANKSVVSVSTSLDSYCVGSPYPNNDFFYTTYDIKTGDNLDVKLLLASFDENVVNLFLKYRAKDSSENPELEADCADSYTTLRLLETEFSFAISEHSIILRPNYPHVSKACEIDSTIPLIELVEYIQADKVHFL